MVEVSKLKASVEALLFISGDGLTVEELASGLQEDPAQIQIILDSLADEYHEREGGIVLEEVAGRYQFRTRSELFSTIQAFLREKKKETLSKSVLETLAIITYKQPITLAEIEELRGVNSRAQVATLLAKKLIRQAGQKEAPGRPTLYVTTKEFLEYFGLNSLEELPPPKDIKELNFEEL